jgi:predicted lactoylglutathione lyase
MGRELYMVVVIVADMGRAVEFYQRLGVDIPPESVNERAVAVKMGGLTFLLTSRRAAAVWDPDRVEPAGGSRIVLEFYLETREAVDAKYAEMIGYGYASYRAPFQTSFGPYFALIQDPDDNTVLISAE